MNTSNRKRNLGIAAGVALCLLCIDRLTKSVFLDQEVGRVFSKPILGLFDIELLHNTGGAWGVLSGSTSALGIFSLIVVGTICLIAWKRSTSSGLIENIAYGMIIAGGIGNAIDRFAYGYVIDFIHPVIIQFPTFNIADIGVTCGFVLLLVAILFEWRNEEAAEEDHEITDTTRKESHRG